MGVVPYWAWAAVERSAATKSDKILGLDFITNLRESDYALCVKGDENASFRFYEALSMGRIPLLLDTECVLPLQDIIDYRSFCVIVDWRDADRIGEKLLAFHEQVSAEEFEAMQRRAREAFVEYLRMDSFTPYLVRQLKQVRSVI